MSDDLPVKLAVYRFFAETGRRPSPEDVGQRAGIPAPDVLEAYGRLRAQRVLVLEDDGASIRMAPPFSGVETQHVVESEGISYFANCAWDSLGIPAALQRPATVLSRCEQSMEPLRLRVGLGGPEGAVADAGWLFHCAVPAAHWWDDIVFT
jgi:alkylmercury lyase-like protein